MNRTDCKKKAKEILNKNFSDIIKIGLVFWFLTVLFGFLIGKFNNRFYSLIEVIVIFPLYVGYINYLLQINKNKNELNYLFSQYKKTLVILLSTIISILLIFIGYIFFIIPGLYIQISLTFIYILIAESDDFNYMNIIKDSFKISRGHIIDIILFYFSFIPWIFLYFITAGLAGIYVIPYMHLSLINMYNQLKIKSE